MENVAMASVYVGRDGKELIVPSKHVPMIAPVMGFATTRMESANVGNHLMDLIVPDWDVQRTVEQMVFVMDKLVDVNVEKNGQDKGFTDVI